MDTRCFDNNVEQVVLSRPPNDKLQLAMPQGLPVAQGCMHPPRFDISTGSVITSRARQNACLHFISIRFQPVMLLIWAIAVPGMFLAIAYG
jgi:hypothetical protein